MNPLQDAQTDSNNSPTKEDQRLLSLYGKNPNKRGLLQDKLKERKFFDSGDYALSKAGKTSDTGITLQTGKSHPLLKNISHRSSPVPSDSNVIQDADLQHQGQKSPSPVEAHSHSHLCGQKSAAADGAAGMKQNESEDYVLAKENVN